MQTGSVPGSTVRPRPVARVPRPERIGRTWFGSFRVPRSCRQQESTLIPSRQPSARQAGRTGELVGMTGRAASIYYAIHPTGVRSRLSALPSPHSIIFRGVPIRLDPGNRHVFGTARLLSGSFPSEWRKHGPARRLWKSLRLKYLMVFSPMILCVTLNPCLDKTLTVPSWRPGDLVRGTRVREVVGGKGNNVARALKRLGRSPRPVTFLGGAIGQHSAELLRRDDELDPIVVETQASTREILTVLTQSTTEQTAFFD